MAAQYTSRGGRKIDFNGKHLNLEELRKKQIENNYLYNEEIPCYPLPVFHVSNLKHDTGPGGLEGISSDSGFRGIKQCLMWFNLAVGPEEIRSAEKKLMEESCPTVAEEEASNFLWKFATSPAFSETSIYGSFRFTLPLQEVLNAYSQQFCSGKPPVMRVCRTSVFKQEVQYTVLVHSPENEKSFSINPHKSDYSKCPRLEDQPEDAVCKYSNGHLIWRSQAMCNTHRYRIDVGENQIKAVLVNKKKFYVWDQVSIALYLEPGQVLELDKDQLGKSLTYCEMFNAPYVKEKRKDDFMDFDEAESLVQGLWSSTQLKKQTSLQEHFEVTDCKGSDPE